MNLAGVFSEVKHVEFLLNTVQIHLKVLEMNSTLDLTLKHKVWAHSDQFALKTGIAPETVYHDFFSISAFLHCFRDNIDELCKIAYITISKRIAGLDNKIQKISTFNSSIFLQLRTKKTYIKPRE